MFHNKVVGNLAHNDDSIRRKLIEITDKGLMLKAIALNVGIDVNDLSRFKGGMNCLKQSDIKRLSEYLNAVIIPQRSSITKKNDKVTSLDIMNEFL